MKETRESHSPEEKSAILTYRDRGKRASLTFVKKEEEARESDIPWQEGTSRVSHS